MSVRGNDSGFTLIELLLTTVILGIIIIALGEATISIINNTDASNQTLVRSHDAQMAASYFANDVQSAYTIDTVDTACDLGGTSVVRLAWTQYAISGSPNSYQVADYVLQGGVFRRHFCQAATANPATMISDVAIASKVAGTPVVTTSSCTDRSNNTVLKTVVVTVTEQAVAKFPTYQFQVSGTRRGATC